MKYLTPNLNELKKKEGETQLSATPGLFASKREELLKQRERGKGEKIPTLIIIIAKKEGAAERDQPDRTSERFG